MEKIKPEEIEKYEKIHEEVVTSKSGDCYNKKVFLAEFRNGTKIKNSLLDDSIVFSVKNDNKIKKLNLKSLLPKFYKIHISKEIGRHSPYDKLVYGPVIENENDLMVGMHEIGHAGDGQKNEEFYMQGDIYATEIIAQQERNAWAGALKNMRLLARRGFVGEDITDTKMMDIAKSAVYNSAKTWPKEDASRCKFLNKEL